MCGFVEKCKYFKDLEKNVVGWALARLGSCLQARKNERRQVDRDKQRSRLYLEQNTYPRRNTGMLRGEREQSIRLGVVIS